MHDLMNQFMSTQTCTDIIADCLGSKITHPSSLDKAKGVRRSQDLRGNINSELEPLERSFARGPSRAVPVHRNGSNTQLEVGIEEVRAFSAVASCGRLRFFVKVPVDANGCPAPDDKNQQLVRKRFQDLVQRQTSEGVNKCRSVIFLDILGWGPDFPGAA